MTRTSWFSAMTERIWKGRSKGVSTVIGTVFLILIILMVSTNVILWTFSQDAQYTQAVQEENQKSVDRLSENVIATGANYSVPGIDDVTVTVTLTNTGSTAVQIINLWVFDTDLKRYANQSMSLNLFPGDVEYLVGGSSPVVIIPGANASHTFVSWFVTGRGNTISLESSIEDFVLAELAQGIGSISMDFPTFRYYEVQPGDVLGPEQYAFNIPGSSESVFGIYLTNLDKRRENINLTSHSCVWLIIPGSATSSSWPIAKVEDNTLVEFDYLILEYGRRTLIYFGGNVPSNLKNNIAAVNILLYGTIGSTDYGQNLPFIALYIGP